MDDVMGLFSPATRAWFEGAFGFRYGSGAAECFRDRENDLRCDHDLLDGCHAEQLSVLDQVI